MKRLTMIALVGLVVYAHSVAAAPPAEPWAPVADARVTAALQIARDYWRADAGCPDYGVFRAHLPSQEAALAEQPGCRMWLSWQVLTLDRSPRALRRRENAYLCVIVVHEYGHSLGFGHVNDPHAVMFHGVLDPRAVPACGRMLEQPRMVPSRRSGTHWGPD